MRLFAGIRLIFCSEKPAAPASCKTNVWSRTPQEAFLSRKEASKLRLLSLT
jgi:hypothetical protein